MVKKNTKVEQLVRWPSCQQSGEWNLLLSVQFVMAGSNVEREKSGRNVSRFLNLSVYHWELGTSLPSVLLRG